MKILLISIFALTLTVIPTSVMAAEITPDPSSYSLGSTSELSATRQTQSTSSEGVSTNSLADTGQDTGLIILVSFALLTVAILIILTKRNKFYRTR